MEGDGDDTLSRGIDDLFDELAELVRRDTAEAVRRHLSEQCMFAQIAHRHEPEFTAFCVDFGPCDLETGPAVGHVLERVVALVDKHLGRK